MALRSSAAMRAAISSAPFAVLDGDEIDRGEMAQELGQARGVGAGMGDELLERGLLDERLAEPDRHRDPQGEGGDEVPELVDVDLRPCR